jgi:hypothetical protein
VWPDTGDDDPPDGDIVFNVVIRDSMLSPTFWTTGFGFGDGDNKASQIQAKLANSINDVHVEIIMYGRSRTCGASDWQVDLPLLPGWADEGANSVLVNGEPLNGRVSWGDRYPSGSHALEFLRPDDLKLRLVRGSLVKIRGFLALDCHSESHATEDSILSGLFGIIPGGFSWFNYSRDCHEDDADVLNVEIHPVYSIDIVADPCYEDRVRLFDLYGELSAVSKQWNPPASKIGAFSPDEILAREQQQQQEIARWHEEHDAEIRQLLQSLSSPQCRVKWPGTNIEPWPVDAPRPVSGFHPGSA